MEQLNGENINVLPFRELKKVTDLIHFEGPILTHFQDRYGKDILYYWIDLNEVVNRWLVFQVSSEQLYKYLAKDISLRHIFESPVNDIFYSVEINENLGYSNMVQIFKENINETYLPEEESFFDSDVPSIYEKKLSEYKISFLTETFLKQALYVKAAPSKKQKARNGGLFPIISGGDMLHGYGAAYEGLVALEVRKEFQNRGIVDERRVKKSIKQVIDLAPLNMVKTKAASFAVAMSPNNFLTLDESFLNTEWRDRVFLQFKRDVIDIDKKTEQEVDDIIKLYGEGNVANIYKPIIDLYTNKNIEINITDKDFVPKRTIKRIEKNIETKLTKKPDTPTDEPIDMLALVKYNKRTNRITEPSHATLFDQSIKTSWVRDEIRTEKKTYKLKHKLFAEYKIVDGVHTLKQEPLDITATGESLLESESDFSNQFGDLYERLIPTENTKLSYPEIEMKTFLLFYVK